MSRIRLGGRTSEWAYCIERAALSAAASAPTADSKRTASRAVKLAQGACAMPARGPLVSESPLSFADLRRDAAAADSEYRLQLYCECRQLGSEPRARSFHAAELDVGREVARSARVIFDTTPMSRVQRRYCRS